MDQDSEPRRPGPIRSLVSRAIDFYVGPADRNSIEYWQRYTFYVITFSGIVAGTLCVVPAIWWLLATQRPSGLILVGFYAIDVSLILVPRAPLRAKTVAIALTFCAIGVYALVMAGPEGGSGIFFTVSVLILSLFVGFRASAIIATLNFAIGMGFGVLHAAGLIGWSALGEFKFFSWVVQGVNIYLMDLTFATANAILIRGVGESFGSLRAAEARARGLLGEKETLIREIYHRAKNNMQVVTSILRIGSGKMRDEASKAVVKDVIDKIGSMSLVHQKLYESRDLSRIGMAGYVGELAALLVSSFGPPEGKVALDLDLEDIQMPIDVAIPCGLVISELVANALKHAFPGERAGRIRISMKAVGDGEAELRISDDGVGVPEGFSPSADRRMGLATAYTIVQHQMRGTIELDPRRGLAYAIRFGLREYAERVKLDG